jgi:hypothetical protein
MQYNSCIMLVKLAFIGIHAEPIHQTGGGMSLGKKVSTINFIFSSVNSLI